MLRREKREAKKKIGRFHAHESFFFEKKKIHLPEALTGHADAIRNSFSKRNKETI